MKLRSVVLSLLAGTALVVPAGAASAAACPSTSAVTVVVDFASLGGGQQTRCTNADPPTGLAALREAGFTPTRASQEPGYFVCRIDGKPANDPCQRTSPANAYWSYWHAKRGGMWTYSSLGAADYDPPPGTVEGWSFGAGTPPSSPPPPAASPAASPASPAASPAASPRPTHSTGAAGSPATAGAVKTPPPSASAAPRVATAAPVMPSESASVAAAMEPAATATSPSATSAAEDPVASRTSYALESGPGAGLIAAIVLVAILVAAGLTTAVRRRRSDGA
ncbi:MAG: hypothetical protein JWO88_1774 [Frankiales bacterium]|nr:hypothetical protein [Frankiales bacterium]